MVPEALREQVEDRLRTADEAVMAMLRAHRALLEVVATALAAPQELNAAEITALFDGMAIDNPTAEQLRDEGAYKEAG